MNGTVKWYNVRNGYGFIAGEDGKDYFVHHTQVPEGVKLFEDTKVIFETAETEKGLQARNIQLSEGSEASAPVATEEPVEEAPVEEESSDEEPAAPAEEEPADEEERPEPTEETPVEEESDDAEEKKE